MILHPYSDSAAFASGGKWEPTQANFPALAHFFKCNDLTNGSVASLSDAFDGTPTGLTGQTNNGDGTISLGAAVNTMGGFILDPPGTKHVVLLTVGKPSATGSNIRFGAITSTSVRGFTNPSITSGSAQAIGDGGAAVIATSTDALPGTAGANWQAKATIIQWGSATGLRHVGYDNTTGAWTTAATPGDLSLHTGITTIDQQINIGAGSRPASIQIWYFTTLPSDNDIQAACAWTMANVIADATAKYAYPRWAGLE